MFFLLGWQKLAREGCLSSISSWMNLDGWQEKWFVSALQRRSLCNHCLFLSQLSYSSKPRTIIFPEGPKADGWFGVTKLLKETLIGASGSAFAKSKEASKAVRGYTSKPMSYANVVRGATGGVLSGS